MKKVKFWLARVTTIRLRFNNQHVTYRPDNHPIYLPNTEPYEYNYVSRQNPELNAYYIQYG